MKKQDDNRTGRIKLPPFTQAFVDRHGTPRFYLRKKGIKPVALPGLPWSPEFMAQPVGMSLPPGPFTHGHALFHGWAFRQAELGFRGVRRSRGGSLGLAGHRFQRLPW